MSEPLFYEIWIKDRKDKTKKEIIIPLDHDGTPRSQIGIKDYVCNQGLFQWADYTKLRTRKMKTVY